MYWNNLPSVSSKYQFVFEHYLSSDNPERYYLPKSKSEYEISYLASF
ncbi:MAG: hypothetical protein LBC61_00715 [Candidatus Peribacteria bacterium]|nr:hypothetical protein [Candidatus Peribacteria bacterium]